MLSPFCIFERKNAQGGDRIYIALQLRDRMWSCDMVSELSARASQLADVP
jgi:hypothetical protein